LLFLGLAALLVGCAPKTAPRPVPRPNPSPAAVAPDSEEVLYFLEHKERWAVKTGADEDARSVPVDPVALRNATPATVASLRRLPRPLGMPLRGGKAGRRYARVETTLYALDVDVVRYKLETEDQDYHVVVRDHGGSTATMIVEFADPTFVSRRSPFRALVTEARRTFSDYFEPRTNWKRKPGHLRIVGPGFFDFKHGQSGVAPNAIEIHPVLSCEVVP
jgi:hypothetical protein